MVSTIFYLTMLTDIKLKMPRGIAHKPYIVDSIPVLTGQRYSVVVSIDINF